MARKTVAERRADVLSTLRNRRGGDHRAEMTVAHATDLLTQQVEHARTSGTDNVAKAQGRASAEALGAVRAFEQVGDAWVLPQDGSAFEALWLALDMGREFVELHED